MENNNCNQCIGEYIRKIRIRGNYSQKMLANSLAISLTAYKAWENGKIDFTVNKLEIICDFYEIDIFTLWESISHVSSFLK